MNGTAAAGAAAPDRFQAALADEERLSIARPVQVTSNGWSGLVLAR